MRAGCARQVEQRAVVVGAVAETAMLEPVVEDDRRKREDSLFR